MRRFVALTCSIISAVLVMAGFSSIALADLRFESEITWSVELDDGLLHVESDITITNLTPNETRGSTIIRYYYDRLSIYVPESVNNFRAFRGNTLLEHTMEAIDDHPEAEGLLEATIELGQRLFYNRSMDLFVEYDIPGDTPRSDSLFRVNPAYVSFGAYGWGDPGLTTVKVIVPGHFDLEVGGAELVETESTGQVNVYTVTGIEDPATFFLYVVGRSDDQLTITKADVSGVDVIVRGWPGDEEWVTDVIHFVETGLPVLQELIAQDWVPGTYLQILESGDVAHSGYGGWYLQDTEVIEVSEWAGPHVVLHELSHTWFNENLFVERWINEGLADEFALQAVVGAGLDPGEISRPTSKPPLNPDVGPLNNWMNLFIKPESQLPDDVEAYEGYGYDASFWVIAALVEEIGVEAMAEVINAAAEDLIAYQGDGEPETVDPKDDWRRFLDLLEEVGGSQTATELFGTLVTDEDLSPRTEARDAYQALAIAGAGWAPPLYVRTAMAEWDFVQLESRIDAAMSVLDTRSGLYSNYETIGIDMPPSIEAEYESASDSMDGAQALANDHVAATQRVIEAQGGASAERGFIDTVGLIGTDISDELDDAVTSLDTESLDDAIAEADELLALLEGAEEEGTRRIGFAGAGLLFGLGGMALVRRRRRSQRESEVETPAA